MTHSRFNFNLVSHRDLRKYLTKKFELEKWEFSSAYDATLAHYQYQPKISYGFPHSRNIKLIAKKLLKEINENFVLPHLCFTKKNMNSTLVDNSDFLEDGTYYFRNADGKRELYNYPVRSLEQIQKIVATKYKKSTEDTQFILEKNTKKTWDFDGQNYELRAYVLVTRIGTNYHFFMYPTIFANFGKDGVNRNAFSEFLQIADPDNINGLHPLMKNIYKLVQKTGLIIANSLGVTNKVYRVENDIRKGHKETDYFKAEFQYNLYGLDICLNEDKQPFLSDIVLNPIFGALQADPKIGKEKAKIYNDIVDNFVIYYDKFKKLNLTTSNFILLSDVPQNSPYKLLVTKKQFDENGESKFDDTLQYAMDTQDFITPQGEELVQNILFENKESLTNSNLLLLDKLGMKPNNTDEFINQDYLVSSAIGGIGEEIKLNTDLEDYIERKKDACEFEKIPNKEEFIQNKIVQLKKKEKREEMLNIAKKTLPIIGIAYAAKKTYNAYYNAQKKEEEKQEELSKQQIKMPLKRVPEKTTTIYNANRNLNVR